MTLPRIMYNNLLDADYLTASSTKAGMVSNVRKEGTGSATMQALGDYSGSSNTQYEIEIDDISGGQEVGQATFQWEDGLGNVGTGVLTDTVETSLSEDVTVKFTSGSGDDFDLGDKWWFKGQNRFLLSQMLTLDRDARYRSASLDSPNYIHVDFGSAQSITCFALLDHNFTSNAIVTLQANSIDDFTSPPFDETLTITDNYTTLFFTAAEYRYWKLVISDNGNADGYIEVGEIFLGNYLELAMGHFYGDSNNPEAIVLDDSVLSGIQRWNYQNTKRSIRLNLANPTKAQRNELWTMFDTLVSRTSNTIKPVFLFLDDVLYLVLLKGIPSSSKSYGMYNVSLVFQEVLTSVSS